MGRGFAFGAAIGAMATAIAVAAPVRVDYNGELVSGPTLIPEQPTQTWGWDYYAEGAGGGAAPSPNGLAWEDESAVISTHPGATGHSVIFGGTSGAGQYGIKQTIASVAGKHYWMGGTAKGSNPTTAYTQWGLSNGFSPGVGMETNGGVFAGTGVLGRQNFAHGIVATGSQITAMAGIRTTGMSNQNINLDGIRVLESDINVYTGLHNGGFDGVRWNVTNWSGANPANPTGVTDLYMFDGWLPLGGMSGQVMRIQAGTGESGQDSCLALDTYKGGGRQYFFQRINDGLPAHEWSVSARVKAAAIADADNRIGIDPTGGMDPNSPNVVWSNTNTAANVWETLNVTAQGIGTNGITVFLASGYDFARGSRAPASTLSYFDSVTPEPASIMLLILGGLACLRRR